MHNYYYKYLADGTKISVVDKSGNGFLYLGSARFELNDGIPTFESVPFSGGRIVKTSNGCLAQYHFTDHLGSTRVVAEQGNQWTDIKRRNYTTFGKEWDMPFYPTSENNFTFSGKERQTVGELRFLDFGARFYDSEGGIFLQQDPLSEKYYHIGQYNYCAGNPIKLVDPDGKAYKTTIDNRNNTITLSQTIYTPYHGYGSASKSAYFWNHLKGCTYTDAMGNKYKVKFNISVKRESYINIANKVEEDPTGNSYIIVSIKQTDSQKIVNGTTSPDRKHIEVDESRYNTDTGAHEIGHTFNMDHTDRGIMTPASNDPNRKRPLITQENINQAIERSENTEVINKTNIWDEIKNFFSPLSTDN